MTLYKNFSFQVTARQEKARRGRLNTPHGPVETPAFIFCATKASLKGTMPQQFEQEKTQIILSNTYHLMLQPGPDVVEKLGGLHKFMGWRGPMLTDSGGFQIFSLGHGSVAEEIKGKRTQHRPQTLLKITEEGACFRSYVDGTRHLLTPERSMEIQRKLGPDLVVVLDECTPFHVTKSYTKKSMDMSHRWAARSLNAFQSHDTGAQALYGIIQGGVYDDLRQESCDFVNNHNFFAHAIGGSLGACKNQMADIVDMTMAKLAPERPVHLLGIGGVSDIFNGVRSGVDTFDCVHPTRLARHGGALLPYSRHPDPEGGREHINLRNSRFAADESPIDDQCACVTCQRFSRGYIHHLLKAHELTALQAITLHNIHFMNTLMEQIRWGIETHRLDEVERLWSKVT